MKILSRMHSFLLATWVVAHIWTALWTLINWRIANDVESGVARLTFEEVFQRLAKTFGWPSWLPDTVIVTSLCIWVVIVVTVFLVSAFLDWCSRRVGAEWSRGATLCALTDTASCALTLIQILISLGLLLAAPQVGDGEIGVLLALLLVLVIGLAMGTDEPALRSGFFGTSVSRLVGRIPVVLVSLLLYVLIYAMLAGLQVINHKLPAPVSMVLDVPLYFAGCIATGFTLSVAVFGLQTLRQGKALLRLGSKHFLLAWAFLDYRLALIVGWVAPTIVLVSFFKWYASPTIYVRYKDAGLPLPTLLNFAINATEWFSRYWYLLVFVAAVSFLVPVHARLLLEIEQRTK